jgi:hypothetical protein
MDEFATANKEQLELLKLKAEAEKAEAERAKAAGELRQSMSLLGRAGTFFTPVVAALTIILGYLAATHSQRAAEAELKQAKAEFNAAKADEEKDRALQQKATVERDLLAAQNTLRETNDLIKERESALQSSQKRLTDLQTEYRSLQNKQILGNLRNVIDILNSDPPAQRTARSRHIEDIRAAVAGDNTYKEVRLAYLTSAAQDAYNPSDLRALLYYALFQITHDNQWLDQIRRLAMRDFVTAVPTFSSLMNLDHFDRKDRIEAMCSSYDKYLQGHPTLQDRYLREHPLGLENQSLKELDEIQHNLVAFDRSANVGCRKPFFDHLRQVQRTLERVKIPDTDKATPYRTILYTHYSHLDNSYAATIPRQAVYIWFVQKNPDLHHVDLSFFHPIMSLPPDFADVLNSLSATAWIRQNRVLISAWTYNDFRHLEESSDATMQKILSDIWITEDDLR